jgi:hypothetical protein
MTIIILDIIHRPTFYFKHAMDFRTSLKIHYVSATSNQVNAIYRFVTMAYQCDYQGEEWCLLGCYAVWML